MCKCRYSDALAVAISLLAGIAFALLYTRDLIRTGIVAPIVAGIVALVALLLLTLGVTSLLRQNQCVNRCIHAQGMRLLLPAMVLLISAVLGIVVTATTSPIPQVITFLLYGSGTMTAIGIFCFLSCLIGAGREPNPCARC